MNNLRFSMPKSAEPPGWYGKLPGMGDFAQRRLPNRFVSVWDRWLQNGFEHLRGLNAEWAKSYLEGHVWFFMLGPSVIGPKPWIGLLVPSVDSVGRYFPMTIAVELIAEMGMPESDLNEEITGGNIGETLSAFAQATLHAIEIDLAAEDFDLSLAQASLAALQVSSYVDTPRAARSTWHTSARFEGVSGFSMGGMPGHAEFALLFSSADEATRALQTMRETTS